MHPTPHTAPKVIPFRPPTPVPIIRTPSSVSLYLRLLKGGVKGAW